MCDACSAKGVNWSLNNGPGRSNLEKAKLYNAVEGKEISLKLCYLCSLSLFMSGEQKFMQNNPRLKSELSQGQGLSDFDF